MQRKEYEQYIDNTLMPKLARKTASKLANSQHELQLCKWTDGESNTDTDFSILAGEKTSESFIEIIRNNDNFNDKINIDIQSPDVNICFNLSEYKSPIKRKIELKSAYCEIGNDAIIPGSTIGKLDINTWLIFVLRKNNQEFDVRYGRYYKGIKVTKNELFQDRTPRPKLLFSNYQKVEETPDTQIVEKDEAWINKYAESAINRIINQSPFKNSSWQDDLVIEILRMVLENDDILPKILQRLNIDKDTLIKKINNI